MRILKKQEQERQDFVDNEIFETIQKLLPANKKLAWDIEMIGMVRDAIRDQIVQRKVMNEMQFYPYLKISNHTP